MMSYNKIAVAIDFSEAANKAFKKAINTAKEFDATLLIVHVVDTKSFGSIAAYDLKYAEELKVKAKEELERLKKVALEEGVAQVETLVEEGAAKTILTSLPEVDLIICGATGYSKIEKLMLGSVAERIVRHSPYDVLVVR
ncbi:MAG: universal stress protein [Lysinibacillus sp.]|nr:universal stress protein [Lysinibacillus sp.]